MLLCVPDIPEQFFTEAQDPDSPLLDIPAFIRRPCIVQVDLHTLYLFVEAFYLFHHFPVDGPSYMSGHPCPGVDLYL